MFLLKNKKLFAIIKSEKTVKIQKIPKGEINDCKKLLSKSINK